MRLVTKNITSSIINTLNESHSHKRIIKESKKIWSSDQEDEYWSSKSLDELRQEFKDNYDYEDVNGVPFEEATEEDFLDFFRPEDYDYAAEDFQEAILPEIEKQCFEDYIVFFGEAANWHSRGPAAKVSKTDKLMNFMYPEYDATTKIIVDNGNLFFGEASHDVPTGYTLGLYSFKDEASYSQAEELLKKYFEDEDFDMYYFEDWADFKCVEQLIQNNLLTPIKNTINDYTGNEEEEK